jgi:hypothetical protein
VGYAKVGLAEEDEGGDDGDRVRNEVYQLDAIEEEKVAEEIAHRDPKPALDACKEDDGLASPLRQKLLARCRPSADLHPGPQ